MNAMADIGTAPGGLLPLLPLAGDVPKGEVRGEIGVTTVLPISALRIDPVFQRPINANSARNVRRIAAEFDWARFLPVIVVPQGDHYSVIDGQHRTTAAAMRGLREVPAYVLSCTPADAAAAFAAINGNVTPVSDVDMYFAELAARAPEALALQAVLDAAEITIVRKRKNFAAGETRAVKVLRRALARHGRDVLITALQCITQTRDGNPGMITGAVVNGIAAAIRAKHALLAEPSRLFEIFDRIDLRRLLDAARKYRVEHGQPEQHSLTVSINAAIRTAGGDAGG